ncbi:MAG TPA: hypothetical protein VFJ77_04515 [Gaiellaceae bacterium]|nr:hypothetical protein [Gaiellaceae bacterium]
MGSVPELPDVTARELAPAARLAALGTLTRAALHAFGNDLFAVLAQLELLREDGGAGVEELRRVEETGRELRRRLSLLGAAARPRGEDGPARVDAEARETATLLQALGRAGELELRLEEGLDAAAAPDTAAQLVLHALLHATAGSGRGDTLAVEARREGELIVLEARASGDGAAEPDGGFGIAVAETLARDLGGSLEPGGRGCRLRLPAA